MYLGLNVSVAKITGNFGLVTFLFKFLQQSPENIWVACQLGYIITESLSIYSCFNLSVLDNILLYADPSKKGYSRLLCIDYEYCSYNFRLVSV